MCDQMQLLIEHNDAQRMATDYSHRIPTIARLDVGDRGWMVAVWCGVVWYVYGV